MKQSLHISAAFDKPELVQNMVERLAYRRHDPSFNNKKIPPGLKALETSSTETYVNGTLAIDSNNAADHINMPFITCFLFTCIKTKNDPYLLIWSSSFS
jgi:hypothetical protein